jgi:hypothetical protein
LPFGGAKVVFNDLNILFQKLKGSHAGLLALGDNIGPDYDIPAGHTDSQMMG